MNLNEICGYLPYKPKAICNDDGEIKEFTLSRCIMMERGEFTYKLILHPLSDLVKPVLPDGKIPIVELAKMADIDNNEYYNSNECVYDAKMYGLKSNGHYQVGLMPTLDFIPHVGFSLLDYGEVINRRGKEPFVETVYLEVNQLQLFQKLYSWHFDIHGLINKKEAIDINTLANARN